MKRELKIIYKQLAKINMKIYKHEKRLDKIGKKNRIAEVSEDVEKNFDKLTDKQKRDKRTIKKHEKKEKYLQNIEG